MDCRVTCTPDNPTVVSTAPNLALSVTGGLRNARSFFEHDPTRRGSPAVSDNHLICVSEQPLRDIPPSTTYMPRRTLHLPDLSTLLMVQLQLWRQRNFPLNTPWCLRLRDFRGLDQ